MTEVVATHSGADVRVAGSPHRARATGRTVGTSTVVFTAVSSAGREHD